MRIMPRPAIICWVVASLWIASEAEDLSSTEESLSTFVATDSVRECLSEGTKLEQGLTLSFLDGSNRSCCNRTVSCLRCRGKKCDAASSAAVKDANCTFLYGDDNDYQNWTCTTTVNSEFRLLAYNVRCSLEPIHDNVTCINEDCCVMYYDVEHISTWYKGWTAIAVITALVILAILLAMLVIHCKTVLKVFHDRRRQASETFSRVTYSK